MRADAAFSMLALWPLKAELEILALHEKLDRLLAANGISPVDR